MTHIIHNVNFSLRTPRLEARKKPGFLRSKKQIRADQCTIIEERPFNVERETVETQPACDLATSKPPAEVPNTLPSKFKRCIVEPCVFGLLRLHGMHREEGIAIHSAARIRKAGNLHTKSQRHILNKCDALQTTPPR